MIYEMILIYCNWVSTVAVVGALYKNRKEAVIYKEETNHKTLQRRRLHKIENKHTKQEN